jgi:MYXO-CTERM domain-containing protein
VDTGIGPWGITNDSTYIYVAIQYDYNVVKIDPSPMVITETIDLGLTSWLDGVTSIGYHAATDALYVGKVDEILKVKWNVTQWDVTQLVSIPGLAPGGLKINNNYLLMQDSTTSAHLLDITAPTPYTTYSWSSIGGVALSDTNVYLCGGDIRKYDFGVTTPLSTVTTTGSLHCDYYFPTAPPPVCGDGNIDAGETCDDNNTANSDGCDSSCHVESGWECSGTPSSCNLICGNGTIDTGEGEQCDGTNVGGQNCSDFGYMPGPLSCDSSCQLDFSQCTPALDCGNNQIDTGEDCDGTNLDGESCTSLGFASGTLTCAPGCTFDTSLCVDPSDCGNGQREGDEECDDGENNSDTVPNACRTDCTNPRCGDGVKDDGEECDGDDLGGLTCSDVGDYTNGNLRCSSCLLDPVDCTYEPCDPNEIVTILTQDIEDPGLTGDLATLYQNNVSSMNDDDASKSCITNEQGSFIQVTSSGYVNFEIDISVTNMALFHAHRFDNKNPIVLVNQNQPEYFWPKSGGGFVIHDGEDPVEDCLNFGFGSGSIPVTVGATQGTIPAWRYSGKYVNSEGTPVSGKFIGFRMFESSIFMALYGNPDNNVVIPTHTPEQLEACKEINDDACWLWMNENDPGDLSALKLDDVIPPNPPGGGCCQSASGNTPPLGSILLLIAGLLLLRLRRRRQIAARD